MFQGADMKKNDATTRERILQAATGLLFKTTPEKITSRSLAQAAGVNVAAINYHFRSKEKLIDEAVEAATAAAFQKGMAVLLNSGAPPRSRLSAFLTGYAFGLIEFPGLTRTAFASIFLRESKSHPYGKYTREMVAGIGKVLGEVSHSADAAANRQKALIILGSIIFPFLISTTAREAEIIDYGNLKARNAFIESVLDLVVKPGEKVPAHV
jgi:AcrR family transcriptional regulator